MGGLRVLSTVVILLSLAAVLSVGADAESSSLDSRRLTDDFDDRSDDAFQTDLEKRRHSSMFRSDLGRRSDWPWTAPVGLAVGRGGPAGFGPTSRHGTTARDVPV